jgi:hypothetical protein
MPVPAVYLQPVNRGLFRLEGEFVLYWMIAARRTRSNFALQQSYGRD